MHMQPAMYNAHATSDVWCTCSWCYGVGSGGGGYGVGGGGGGYGGGSGGEVMVLVVAGEVMVLLLG